MYSYFKVITQLLSVSQFAIRHLRARKWHALSQSLAVLFNFAIANVAVDRERLLRRRCVDSRWWLTIASSAAIMVVPVSSIWAPSSDKSHVVVIVGDCHSHYRCKFVSHSSQNQEWPMRSDTRRVVCSELVTVQSRRLFYGFFPLQIYKLVWPPLVSIILIFCDKGRLPSKSHNNVKLIYRSVSWISEIYHL